MDPNLMKDTYLPMTETAYYILLSLNQPRHGYGIIQHVEDLTGGRIRLGPGTIYGTLSKLEKEGLIHPGNEQDRRKIYRLGEKGRQLLTLEIARLAELLDHGQKEMEGQR